MIKQVLILSIITLSLLSCSKEEGEGGRASITGTIEGTQIATARAEVTELTAVPGHEISKQDFFLLNTPGSAVNYTVWFRDANNVTGAPTINGRTLIQIDYSNASSNIDIAVSIEAAIEAIATAPFIVSRTNDIITLTNTNAGYVADADNGTSDIVVDVIDQGRDEVTLQSGPFADEDVYIIYGDVDEIHDDNVKTNFDGTFKFSNLRKGTYKIFAYSEDESNVNAPLRPVFKEIEIAKSDAANIGTITIEKK